ncbi:MAG: hypothetical protein AB1791_21640 [Chloroflexota bacterium]
MAEEDLDKLRERSIRAAEMEQAAAGRPVTSGGLRGLLGRLSPSQRLILALLLLLNVMVFGCAVLLAAGRIVF